MLCALYCILKTLYYISYIIYSTLNITNSTIYTVQYILSVPHTLYSYIQHPYALYSILPTQGSVLYIIYCILNTQHYIHYDLHCTIYTRSALYCILLHSTLYNDLCPILPTQDSVLYILYYALNTQHYILYDIHCTIWSNI